VTPFRQPPPVEPPPPSVDTGDLQKEIQRKRRRVMIVSICVALLFPGLIFVPHYWEAFKDWRAERKYKSNPLNQEVRLEPADAARVTKAIAAAEESRTRREKAFAEAWSTFVEGTVGERADLGRCEVKIPAPELDTRSGFDGFSGDGRVTVLDGARLEFDVLVVDATEKAVVEGVSTAVPASIAGSRVRITKPNAPLPSAATDGAAKRLAELRAKAAKPFMRREHDAFVREAERWGRGNGYGYDLVQVIDIWVAPASLGNHEFRAGIVGARSFVWSPTRERVVCAATTIAKSSSAVSWKSSGLAATSDPHQKDLFFQLQKRVSERMAAAGPTTPFAFDRRTYLGE